MSRSHRTSAACCPTKSCVNGPQLHRIPSPSRVTVGTRRGDGGAGPRRPHSPAAAAGGAGPGGGGPFRGGEWGGLGGGGAGGGPPGPGRGPTPPPGAGGVLSPPARPPLGGGPAGHPPG